MHWLAVHRRDCWLVLSAAATGFLLKVISRSSTSFLQRLVAAGARMCSAIKQLSGMIKKTQPGQCYGFQSSSSDLVLKGKNREFLGLETTINTTSDSRKHIDLLALPVAPSHTQFAGVEIVAFYSLIRS